jgi:hypothetical protein
MRSVLLAALAVTACSSEPTRGSGGAASITPNDLQHRVGLLAHDSMRGRNTPSPELDQTADYIAAEFTRLGLTPAGDNGGFIQRYALQQVRVDTAASGATLAGRRLRFGADLARWRGSWTTTTPLTGNVTVLREAPAAGVSLAGRVAVLMTSLGEDGMPDQAGGRALRAVQLANPVALFIVVNPTDTAWANVTAAQNRPTMHVPWQTGGRAPGIYVRRAALPAPGALTGTRAEVTLVPEVLEALSAPNVAGILPGSDPTLASEYLVYSAHMDHVGVGRPVNGDSIYNGADDDASGTATVLELAEAFAGAAERPRRSIVFLVVSGEEKGLWGSEYFAFHPTIPIEQVVANLNIDMVGRNWTDTIVAIGKEHSDLGATLNAVNAEFPDIRMTAIDDLWPDENFYFRSDHYNFARRGVPILFFFNGTHDDYHRPSDQSELIDYEKTARIGRLLFHLGARVGNADQRPQWNPESRAQIVRN